MAYYHYWNDGYIVWREFYENPSRMMDCAIEDGEIKWVKSFYVMGNINLTQINFEHACLVCSDVEIVKFIYKVVKIPQYCLEKGIYKIFEQLGESDTKEFLKKTKINKLFNRISQTRLFSNRSIDFTKFLWNSAKENPKIGKIKLHENEEEIFINACCDPCDNIDKIKWLIHIGKTDPYADGPITQYRKGFVEACSCGNVKVAKYLWNLDERSIKESDYLKIFIDLCWKNEFYIAEWMVKAKCIKKIERRNFATNMFKYLHKRFSGGKMAKLIYKISKNGLVSHPIHKHELSIEELKFYNKLKDHYK